MQNQKGQVLLITLLILIVAITIALSLLSRTTTDTTVSRQVEESLRAFSAAEAGIERSLQQGFKASGDLSFPETNSSANVSEAALGSGLSYDFGGETFTQGSDATLWLSFYDITNSSALSLNQLLKDPRYTNDFNLCWSVGSGAAIEVSIYYQDASNNYSVSRWAYDPDNSRIVTNHFTIANAEAGNTCDSAAAAGSYYKVSIDNSSVGSKPLFARIKFYYNTVPTKLIAIPEVNNFSSQGNEFTSCGTAGANVTKCIKAVQPYKAPLGIFDNVLYASSGSIQ